MRLIDIIKNQLESEGYSIVKKKVGDEACFLSFVQLTDQHAYPMRTLLFFNSNGDKIKEITSFPQP